MRKLLLTALSVLLVAATAFGQNRQVSGVVSGSDGSPLAGVTVVLEGSTSVGTTTDVSGRYSLSVPSNGTLSFSFIGMEPRSEAVNGRALINVTLADASLQADEVLVVAYGTVSKDAFTGSAAQINADDLGRRQVSNVTTALAGQVPGLQMAQGSGQPGSTSTVRIRGFGSINAEASPLYVIDGVPFSGDITGLNPSDVESITVLKDAASNSLYGSRGANGVIMITTKRGRSGDAVITVDAKWGVNTRAVPEYDIFTGSDKDLRAYYNTYWQAVRNGAASTVTDASVGATALSGLKYQVYAPPAGGEFWVNGKVNPAAKQGYWNGSRYLLADDWADAAFNNGLRQEYNASVAGTTDKINYYFSAGYLNDKGYAVNTNFDRISSRLKADYQAKKWLNLTANVSYSNITSNAPLTESLSSTNLFYFTRHIAPIYPLYVRDQQGEIMIDNNGRKVYDYGDNQTSGIVRPFSGNSNPVSAQELDKNFRRVDLLSLRSGAEITFMEGLKGFVNVGLETDNTRFQVMDNPYYGQSGTTGGAVEVEASSSTTLNLQQLLTWVESCGKHNWDVLLGHEYYSRKWDAVNGVGFNMFNPDVIEVNNTLNDEKRKGYSSADEYFTEGFFARGQYNYDGKYFFSASYRRDGSSIFAPENRWGDFWSVGASWLVTRESFMQDLDWVNMLKLKASYGTQGNDALLNAARTARDYHAYANRYAQSNVAGSFAVARSVVGNRDISWEDNQNFNTGVEFSLFKDKLSGSFEYFVRTTRNMLFQRPVARSLGYSSYPDNIGDMRNAGYEIDLLYTPYKTEDLTWNIYANATHIKNKILSLPPESREAGIQSGQFRYFEGGSIYDYYVRDWAGVDPATGNAMWYKVNADGSRGAATSVYSETQERLVGKSSVPDLYGGFGTSVYWRNFDLNLAFTYQFGGYGLDQEYMYLMHSGISSSLGHNWHKDVLKAWTPTNTNTNVPKVSTAGENDAARSTRFLVKSDFLSLQNVTLGYTLPKAWTEKLDISSVRLYVVADNVWMDSARKGYDPRMAINGLSTGNYSLIRTISGGVTFKF